MFLEALIQFVSIRQNDRRAGHRRMPRTSADGRDEGRLGNIDYFVRSGFAEAEASGALGDSENVSQTFQPSGRSLLSNSS
jgi:hypothetical protein